MKTLIIVLSSVALTTAITACGKPFQPPPPPVERWQKSGSSQLEIKKALLECGEPSPYKGFDELITNNSYALTQLCMQKNGFIFDRRTKTQCSVYPNLDACKPENAGDIPDRDINRRLNSPFCKRVNRPNYPQNYLECN